MSAASEDPPPAPPWLRVLHGAPAPEEVAALIAVLLARRAGTAPAPTGYEAWRARRLVALRGARPRP